MGAHEGCDGFWRAMTVRGNHRVGIGDVQLQPSAGLIDLAGACERFGHLHRLPEMRDRLLERRTVKRKVARPAPIFDRGLSEARLREVMGEQFGLGLDDVGKMLAQRLRDLLMQDLPPALEQAFVGGVADQSVLERVARGRQLAGAEDELRILQLRERGPQRWLVVADDGVQQGIGEFAPNRRADLRDVLNRGEAIEARHQRILQCRGNRKRRQRPVEAVSVRPLDEEPGFKHVLRQLFQKERHPVGLDDDLREHFGGELSAASDALDERFRLDSVETAKGHHRDVGRGRPWRFEFGTEGDQQQRRQSWNALEQEVQHFERSRIGPLRVLKHDQQRLLFREALHLVAQRRKGQAALLVGRTAHRGIPGAEWNRQHRCDQWGDLVHAVGRGAERSLQFVELDLGWLLRSDACRALELLGERIERAVAMIG